jgi:hypothetical protein
VGLVIIVLRLKVVEVLKLLQTGVSIANTASYYGSAASFNGLLEQIME